MSMLYISDPTLGLILGRMYRLSVFFSKDCLNFLSPTSTLWKKGFYFLGLFSLNSDKGFDYSSSLVF